MNPIIYQADNSSPGNPFDGLKEFSAQAVSPSELSKPSECTSSAPAAPQVWFAQRFPNAFRTHGEALLLTDAKEGRLSIVSLKESFMACALGESAGFSGSIFYLEAENIFLRYESDPESPKHGLYVDCTSRDMEAVLVGILRKFATECAADMNLESIGFKLSKHRNLRDIIERAKALLKTEPLSFKSSSSAGFVCQNGFLRFETGTLEPLSPALRLRSKSKVVFEPGAACPRFLAFLAETLGGDDIELLQRYSGLLLTGVNRAQVIMVLNGRSGAGKGTILRIVRYILGDEHVTELRTRHLDDRFELGLIAKATLLIGADVPQNFLSHEGAKRLKAMSGGDALTLETKHSGTSQLRDGDFNIVLSCNQFPRINLEGDFDAWSRRLIVIQFHERPQKSASSDPDLDAKLIQSEGSGILNWCLDGLRHLTKAGGTLRRTPSQYLLVEKLIGGSDSVGAFIRSRVEAAQGQSLKFSEAYAAYDEFCKLRDWMPESENKFGAKLKEHLLNDYGLRQRNDLSTPTGSSRGWVGIRLRAMTEAPDASDAFSPHQDP